MLRYGLIIAVCLASGCSTRKETDLLEARLRDQEERLTQTLDDLQRTRSELELTRKESQDLRTQLVRKGRPVLQPEQADVFYRLSGLRIDPLQSAILPASHESERILNLVVTPVDQYDQPLKYPANLTLIAKAKDAEIARLDYQAAEVAAKWSEGWLSSGYVLQIPIATAKLEAEAIAVEVQFLTPDGRDFSSQVTLPGLNAERSEASSILQVSAEEERDSAMDDEDQQEATRIDHSDRRTIDEFPVLR